MHEYSNSDFPIGTLVEIIPGPKVAYRPGTGIVMDWSAANVYEPSEVQLYINEEVFWIRANSVKRSMAKSA